MIIGHVPWLVVVEIGVVLQQFPGDAVVVGVVQQHSFPGLVGRFAGAQHRLAAQAQRELQEPAPQPYKYEPAPPHKYEPAPQSHKYLQGIVFTVVFFFFFVAVSLFWFCFSPNQVVFRSSQPRQILINIGYGVLYAICFYCQVMHCGTYS